MKKEEFDKNTRSYLKNKGYKVYSEKEYKGRRKPDFVAIKGNEILIIETKSPSESKNNSWLSTKGDYLEKCRAKCKHLNKKLEKGVAKWMVVIGGQLQYYIKKMNEVWEPPIPITKTNIIVPVLAFPIDQEERIQKALKELELPDKKFKKIPNQMLLFLNRNELLKITW